MSLDLLIIKPGAQKALYQTLSEGISGLEPPVWPALLAAYVRDKGFSVKIVDAEIQPTELPNECGLIAVVVSGTNPSASTMNMIGARTLLHALNILAPQTPKILMGLHPSALPERTLKEEPVDMVCQGEGFSTLWALLTDEPKQNIPGLVYMIGTEAIRVNPPAKLVDLNLLPMPAWDLLPMEKYRAHNWHCFGKDINNRDHYGVIYTSLGCPFNCSFCCINAMFGKHCYRMRSPDKVIEEIDYQVEHFGIHHLKIIDEMFDLNEQHVTNICNLLIERDYDLNIWAYARVDTINERKLKIMKKAGVNWLGIGYESGSEAVRGKVSKGKFDNDAILFATERIKNAGINVGGNFIFGLPGDDHQSMTETLALAKKLNCEYSNFYVAMAYPGSELYAEQKRDDNPENWAEYSQFGYETKPVSNPYLSPKTILQFRDNAFNDYFSSKQYQEMILQKFGQETLAHINKMLKHKLKRKLLEEKKDEEDV
jgi:anaerobic magnesium-protoporphyrin IX monomethyl ester cyclase